LNPTLLLPFFQHLTFGVVIYNCSTHLICHFEAAKCFSFKPMLKRLRKLIPIKDDALQYEFSPQPMIYNTIHSPTAEPRWQYPKANLERTLLSSSVVHHLYASYSYHHIRRSQIDCNHSQFIISNVAFALSKRIITSPATNTHSYGAFNAIFPVLCG